ncbi:hypothetical protein HDV63DRAFT_405026 [Trichoderma sp. SZMC 28014]
MSQIKQKKAWILTPNQDYTAAGILQLGQILTDYTDPNSGILGAGIAPIPKEMIKDEIGHRNVNFESSESSQTAFQAWLKATLHVAASFAIKKELQKAYQAKFEGQNMSVITFCPTKRYVETALSQEDASDLTSKPWYAKNKRIWVVTGLRILGSGTKISEGFVNQATDNAEVKGDSGAAQVPINAGLDTSYQQDTFHSHTIQDSDPFVYCYRLHEIIIRRKLKTTVRAFSRRHIQGIERIDESSDDEDYDSEGEPIIDGYEVVYVENEDFLGDGKKTDSLFVE